MAVLGKILATLGVRAVGSLNSGGVWLALSLGRPDGVPLFAVIEIHFTGHPT